MLIFTSYFYLQLYLYLTFFKFCFHKICKKNFFYKLNVHWYVSAESAVAQKLAR